LWRPLASRRLKSDRFYTDDYTAAVYTRAGIDWIDNNNMTTVLLRYFPELTPILQRTSNAFAPWRVSWRPVAPVVDRRRAERLPPCAWPRRPILYCRTRLWHDI
jgi:hypothetical protein